jgi:hypothetical protein
MIRKGTEKLYLESEANRFKEAKENHLRNGDIDSAKKAEEFENTFRNNASKYPNVDSTQKKGCLGILMLMIIIPSLITISLILI